MAEQAEQRETKQEDLDARVEALLREMEETSDRVVRRRQDEDDDVAPTLGDLATGNAAPAGDAGARGPGASQGDPAAEDQAGGSPAVARSVMQEAAAELAGGAEGQSEGVGKVEAASSAAPSAEGASVDALDELLAAAAADVIAHEEEEEEVESALNTAVARGPVGAAVAIAERVDGGESARAPVVTVEPARAGAVAPRAVEADAPAVIEVTPQLGPGDVRAEAVAGDAAGAGVAAHSGPPHAPAATMAPPAERPGWARRVVDVFVHNAMGAAASARPHAIRFAWRLEQYTLRLSPGARATIKCVALWTLFNAAGAWVFVMMRTPAKPPVVEEAVPTVISGAPVADAGG